MRQLTYVGGSTIEWRDVPEPKLQDDREALVPPLNEAIDDPTIRSRSFAMALNEAGR